MKIRRFLYLLSLVFVWVNYQGVYGFGKNKVIYKDFEWYYLQSKHFDVYFYEGGQDIAEFTAESAESAYVQIRRDWNYDVKDRIVFIVYRSHNDWQQTNVVISYLEEGIGGVTELFKNRIVVPFEGSYQQFRHVIHHELVHAVMNDMLYGGSIQSLIVGEATAVPLWFAEGLAEFQSTGWNTRTDMIVRDAILHGRMPNLQRLQYYLVYQGGASVFRYIASTYGRKKIGEVLNKLRGKVVFSQVLKSSLGIDTEEFTKRWHRYLQRIYWPEVAKRKEPAEIAKKLTDHTKVPNYLNVSPVISPNGDKIAFISDRKGSQNIYLMSAIDGKSIKTLIKGQRSRSFEELQFLRPGMTFSPDGKKLAFTAKSGARDAIYIVDVHSGKYQQHEVELDGAFTASWSPDGRRIAFIGNKNGQSDIYIMELPGGKTVQLTNDVFTDDQPSWSPDGRKIVFVSDRKDYLDQKQLPKDFNMAHFEFEGRDVYILNVDSTNIQRITDTPWEEANPIFAPDGQRLAYVSEKNGISNLFLHHLGSGHADPITDVISGIFQINWDRNANKLVFTTFFEGGFDIYIMNNPLEKKAVEIKETQFLKEMNSGALPVYAREWRSAKDEAPAAGTGSATGSSLTDYSRYVFQRSKMKPKEAENVKEAVGLSGNIYRDHQGNFKVRKYKLKFSPDVVSGTAGYNTFFGFSGYTTLAFSDLLGDHNILLNINLVSDLKNSDLQALYLNMKKRISWGIGGYHQAWFLSDGVRLKRYRNYGLNFLTAYPLSKFNRIEFKVDWFNVKSEDLTFVDVPDKRISTILPTLAYVHDTVLWGRSGPIDGSRYALSMIFSPKYEKKSREFASFSFDYRKYLMLNRNYNFAFRMTGGGSFGAEPQRFFLGGIDNWINFKSRAGGRTLRTNEIGDIFFSKFITPLRGAYFYQREGDRYLLSNMEFHFPLIKLLSLGLPPINLFNLQGVMFYDIGTAWKSENHLFRAPKWRGVFTDENGNRRFRDLVSGYGIGTRVLLPYFMLRIDVAWNFDLYRSSEPIWYLSLGSDL